MLLPRLTNCPECASIPSLLANIDCKLNQLASALYNNTIFALNQPISAVTMLDLLNYKRILAYRICNPDYAGLYTLNMIASRVIILTGNCKTNCGGASQQNVPVHSSTTTTTCPPTTTSTTTSSSSTSTSTTTHTPTTTTTTTTHTPTTTTTTTVVPNCVLDGTIECDNTTTTSSTSTTTTSSSSTTTTTTTSGEPTTTTTTTVPPIVDTYGYLYNWWAATDVRNIANTDWHVPSNVEMVDLRQYLDPLGSESVNVAGGAMKTTGTTYWAAPNTGATNSSNLSVRGCGQRYTLFTQINVFTGFWNTLSANPSQGGVSTLAYDTAKFFAGLAVSTDKGAGISIILRKDNPTVGGDGTIITNGYTGNNGVMYDTVIIDGYEWLGAIFKETKYRDLSNIPIVQDPGAWISLTTGALCYYVI